VEQSERDKKKHFYDSFNDKDSGRILRHNINAIETASWRKLRVDTSPARQDQGAGYKVGLTGNLSAMKGSSEVPSPSGDVSRAGCLDRWAERIVTGF